MAAATSLFPEGENATAAIPFKMEPFHWFLISMVSESQTKRNGFGPSSPVATRTPSG